MRPPDVAKVLAAATLVNTFGNGLFLTTSVLFFTRSVGLPPVRVGLGLTVAGIVGLAAGIPLGDLSDRLGARGTYIALLTLEGIGIGLFGFVHSFPLFLAVVCVVAFVHEGGLAVRQALIGRLTQDHDRVRNRAYIRAVANVGVSLGAIGAAVALRFDTRAAYLVLVYVDAATCIVSGLLLLRVQRIPVMDSTQGKRRSSFAVLRDGRYVAVAGVDMVLTMHYGLFEVGMPLWVAERTKAPTWIVGGLFLLSSVSCVLFQVRASRGADTISGAAGASRRGGWLLAGCCILFALSYHGEPAVAIPLLLLATLAEVLGEVFQAAGSWGLGFGLAPSLLQGQYQGLFTTGTALGGCLAPLVVTVLILEWGVPGWIALGAIFCLAGTAMPHVAQWADRRVLSVRISASEETL